MLVFNQKLILNLNRCLSAVFAQLMYLKGKCSLLSFAILGYTSQILFGCDWCGRGVLAWLVPKPAEPLVDLDVKSVWLLCVFLLCAVPWYSVLPLRAYLHQEGSVQAHICTGAGMWLSVLDGPVVARALVKNMFLKLQGGNSVSFQKQPAVSNLPWRFSCIWSMLS